MCNCFYNHVVFMHKTPKRDGFSFWATVVQLVRQSVVVFESQEGCMSAKSFPKVINKAFIILLFILSTNVRTHGLHNWLNKKNNHHINKYLKAIDLYKFTCMIALHTHSRLAASAAHHENRIWRAHLDHLSSLRSLSLLVILLASQ